MDGGGGRYFKLMGLGASVPTILKMIVPHEFGKKLHVPETVHRPFSLVSEISQSFLW